jgi:rubrerythrin
VKNPTSMGMNRTGLAISPIDGPLMVQGAVDGTPNAGPDGVGIARIRTSYARDAEPVGTVPPPASVKGVAKAAVGLVKGERVNVLIDRLGARLAFERLGTRMYDAILAKFDAVGTYPGGPQREQLLRFREEEHTHMEWARESLLELGADPTVMTPSADVGGVESFGLLHVMVDPRTNLGETIHALLIAELADNDSWTLVMRLAQTLGHDQIAQRCGQALAEEDVHLQHVRQWITAHVLGDASVASAPRP